MVYHCLHLYHQYITVGKECFSYCHSAASDRTDVVAGFDERYSLNM